MQHFDVAGTDTSSLATYIDTLAQRADLIEYPST
jgi:hypothetical protein